MNDGGAAACAFNMSPIFHIGKQTAPFLTIHGENDEIVPYEQSVAFHRALQKAGVPSILISGRNAGHIFYSAELIDHMRKFLEVRLSGSDLNNDEAVVDESLMKSPHPSELRLEVVEPKLRMP